MVLKTINNRNKTEVFRELGSAFTFVSSQKATDHFQSMLSDMFGENLADSSGVFAIVDSHSPNTEAFCLYDEDWHFLYTGDGKQFTQIVAPVRK